MKSFVAFHWIFFMTVTPAFVMLTSPKGAGERLKEPMRYPKLDLNKLPQEETSVENFCPSKPITSFSDLRELGSHKRKHEDIFPLKPPIANSSPDSKSAKLLLLVKKENCDPGPNDDSTSSAHKFPSVTGNILKKSKILHDTNYGPEYVSKGKNELANMHSWKFLREGPEDGNPDCFEEHLPHPELKKFLSFLNSCKEKEDWDDSFFWIPRENAKQILEKFYLHRKGNCFREDVSKNVKHRVLYETVLRVSDKRIKLDQYPFFSLGLINHMETKLQSRIKNYLELETHSEKGSSLSKDFIQNPKIEIQLNLCCFSNIYLNQIHRAIDYIKNMTKVIHFLITTYLSLFKENPSTIEASENIVNFIKQIWEMAEKGEESFIQRHPWMKKIKNLFRIEEHYYWNYEFLYQHADLYTNAWNFVHYWIQENGKLVKHMGTKYQKDSLSSLINNLILYSNHETVSRDILESQKKQEARKKTQKNKDWCFSY
ncbi:hypothetical protein PGT21_004464 [Puccinia graminis f. sp. tritici]|uniref:Uncharacterized protein n=1 Tax=Puccinia graminis f. sp. tritici TaxID=56615 RepID=A0A5B0NI71_PUCGR|nr:hypothetical protein PGT21_004464 [Puccinia graminis f. sp. tritici]